MPTFLEAKPDPCALLRNVGAQFSKKVIFHNQKKGEKYDGSTSLCDLNYSRGAARTLSAYVNVGGLAERMNERGLKATFDGTPAAAKDQDKTEIVWSGAMPVSVNLLAAEEEALDVPKYKRASQASGDRCP